MNLAGSSVSEKEVKDWIAQSVEDLFREKVKEILSETLAAFVKDNEQRARELSLMERVIRVEEELRALREIQNAHFQVSEKRFEAMEKRFEALQREMNARFEAMQRETNARFEAMDKRFTQLQWIIGLGFSLMAALMGTLRLFG